MLCSRPARRTGSGARPTARPTARALRSPTRQGGTRGRPRRRRRLGARRKGVGRKGVGRRPNRWTPGIRPTAGRAGKHCNQLAGTLDGGRVSGQAPRPDQWRQKNALGLSGSSGICWTTSQCSAMRPSRTRNRSTVASRAPCPVSMRVCTATWSAFGEDPLDGDLAGAQPFTTKQPGEDRRLGSPSELCAPGISRNGDQDSGGVVGEDDPVGVDEVAQLPASRDVSCAHPTVLSVTVSLVTVSSGILTSGVSPGGAVPSTVASAVNMKPWTRFRKTAGSPCRTTGVG